MAAIRKRYGQLDSVVLPPDHHSPPQLAVVLCHGYGRLGPILVPLGFELLQRHPCSSNRAICLSCVR